MRKLSLVFLCFCATFVGCTSSEYKVVGVATGTVTTVNTITEKTAHSCRIVLKLDKEAISIAFTLSTGYNFTDYSVDECRTLRPGDIKNISLIGEVPKRLYVWDTEDMNWFIGEPLKTN